MSDCQTTDKPVLDMPVICVNGTKIDTDKLSRAVQYFPAQSLGQAIQQTGQTLVIQELLSQISGLPVDDEQALVEFVEQQIELDEITDEDCRRFFENNPDKFRTSPLVELRHILLIVSHKDIEKRLEQHKLAKTLISELSKADDFNGTFASMAQQYSACSSKKEGGRLGQISAGQTAKEFERQVFPLEVGFCSNPIETRYGYHIVCIDQKQDGKPMTLDMSMDKVRNYLVDRRQRQMISQYLHDQVAQADISGITMRMEQDNIFMG